ncbi:MAG: protein kinase [Acidimicrobiales bacterium]|nr:protein kinase [Acidimicrobiales bacterium]
MKAIGDLEDFELIGSGGNAHVYRARDTVHDRVVAVKVLRAGGGDVVRRRFDRERKSMGRLSGIPGLLTIYSSGYTGDDDPYLVMPYCPGGSLKDHIDDHGPLPITEALSHIQTIAGGVEEAHRRDVLHCDIKPSNILIDDGGQPRLADFGIAELVGQTTSISGAMVTPSYTPPERFDGEGPSRSGDVYALGATLYALLAGHPPFGSETATSQAVLIRQILEEPLPFEALPATVPASVRKLIQRATAKQAEQRFASAGELATALDAEIKKLAGSPPVVEAPKTTPPPPLPPGLAAIPVPPDPLAPDPAADEPAGPADRAPDPSTRESPFDPDEDRPAPGFRSGRDAPERIEMQEIADHSPLRRPRVAVDDNPTRARPAPQPEPTKKSRAPMLLAALLLVGAAAGGFWYLDRTPPLAAPGDVALIRTAAATATVSWAAEDEFAYRVIVTDSPEAAAAPEVDESAAPGQAVDGPPFAIEVGYDQAVCVHIRASLDGDSTTSDPVCLDAEPAPPTEPIVTVSTDDNVIVAGIVGSRRRADDIIEAAEAVFDRAVVRDHLWVESSVLEGPLRIETTAARHGAAELEQFDRLAADLGVPLVVTDAAPTLPVAPLSGRHGQRIDAETLADWVRFVEAAPETRFDVRATTTRLGSAATNQFLSQARAAEIVAALVDAGAPAIRLRAVGTGESTPALPAAMLVQRPE